MHNKPNNRNKQQAPVRNLSAFVSAYIGSKSGQAALKRGPIRKKDASGKFVEVWRSPTMAYAFQQSIT